MLDNTAKHKQSTQRSGPPATTADAREKQMGALAYDLAEKQLRNGTASSQVITHFLKIVSTKEQLEKQILEEQKTLIKAKAEAIESAKRVEELYSKALSAFKSYGGEVRGNDDQDVS